MLKPKISLLLFLLPAAVHAGMWGENWGSMYWGSNTAEKPAVAPTIVLAVLRGGTLTIRIQNYAVGSGDDGWSAITGYGVSVGGQTVFSSEPEISIRGLASSDSYEISVFAINDEGESTPTYYLVEASSLGLPAGVLQLLLDDE